MDKLCVLPSIKDEIKDNNIWCVAFQLAWNKFQYDELNNEFAFNEENKTINNLISKDNKNYSLNEADYYVNMGTATFDFKKQLEADIMAKFNQQSDILNLLDWQEKSDLLVIYAMLIKNFVFATPFRLLGDGSFNSVQKASYFGATQTDTNLLRMVNPCFYEAENEFAVSLDSFNSEDMIILYRTDNKMNFEKAYKAFLSKCGQGSANIKPRSFKAPILNVDILGEFKQLKDEVLIRKMDNMPYKINKAIQSIKFKLNEKGAQLKSEAAMAIARCSVILDYEYKDFAFDKTFYLFYVEKSNNPNNLPILAIRVQDIDCFNK